MISMFRFLFVIAYSQYGGGAILNDKQRNKYNINFYFLKYIYRYSLYE